MADQVKYPGRLISIDGSRGNDVTRAAVDAAEALRRDGVESAISRWDASGLFADLAAAGGDSNLSIRTLSLVFAADLAFRLRWEIRPVLEAGGVVIAAPYVDTAIAFGAAYGLDDEWLRSLLRFAQPADIRGRARERKIDRPWKQRADRGYAEFGALMLDTTAPKRVSKAARNRTMAWLDDARGRGVVHLTTKGLGELAGSLTGSRAAGARPSRARPRNAQT
jgi:hypothetical protein